MSTSEFSYIPESPEQSFGNNKGIFTPTDIYDLTRADKYTNYGQLELIETQTVSTSTATVEFTNLVGYDVHFLTHNDVTPANDGALLMLELSNDGGSSYETSNYDYAHQTGTASNTFSEARSTTAGQVFLTGDLGNTTNETGNGYCYMYHLLDSTKFSAFTHMGTDIVSSGNHRMMYGSAIYHNAEENNAFRLKMNSGNITGATFSLYGMKVYN